MVGLDIRHPALDRPILLPFRPIETLTVDQILSLIERVVQSKNDLKFDEFMTIRAVVVQNPVGAGRTPRNTFSNMADHIKFHRKPGGSLTTVGLH